MNEAPDREWLPSEPDRTCTWQGCQSSGEYARVAADGQTWAFLCPKHDKALETAFSPEGWTPNRVMRAWILAQGGAAKAADRMGL